MKFTQYLLSGSLFEKKKIEDPRDVLPDLVRQTQNQMAQATDTIDIYRCQGALFLLEKLGAKYVLLPKQTTTGEEGST